ncbi:preprotein translocase subunit YajC [Endothiovibrio diazotrophicus]
MDFFIATAQAQEAAAGAAAQPGALETFLPLIVLFVIFYFMLIRPQSKRAKEHKAMVEALAKGDEVVTSGGLLGKVTKVSEDFLTVEVAEGTEVKVQRQMVASVMPKGTIKGA